MIGTMKIATRNEIHTLIDHYNYQKVAEIGCFECVFLKKIAESKAKEIWGIDRWKECPENQAKNDARLPQAVLDLQYAKAVELSEKDNRIHILRKDSDIAHQDFADNYFDLVYLDADHSYQGIKNDIIHWWPKVRTGGMLCGHDYIEMTTWGPDVHFGVIQAVDEFVKANRLEDKFFTTEKFEFWASWFILK